MSFSFSKKYGACGPQRVSQILTPQDGTLCVICTFPITTTGHHPSGPALQRTEKTGSRPSCLGTLEGSGSFLKVLFRPSLSPGQVDPAWCCTTLQPHQADLRLRKPVPTEVLVPNGLLSPEAEATPLSFYLQGSCFFMCCLSF